MDSATSNATSTNGQNRLNEIFALSDEQILDIEPCIGATNGEQHVRANQPPNLPQDGTPAAEPPSASYESRATSHDAAEPPPWLAAQMQDPWGGEEAREFWDGVQQARSEAAAYRAAIATPEDARALKELYPGGVSQARAVAERARLLDDVDRAYFGASGNSPEQTSASRVQLAQRMLREDPAAFREMVEAGVKVSQEAAGSHAQGAKTLASAVSDVTRTASPAANDPSVVVAQHSVPLQRNQAAVSANARDNEHVAAYAAFERAANEDLERSVGAAIERTLAQALPVAQPLTPALRNEGTEHAGSTAQARSSPLQERLATGIRAEVEKSLQTDRQLSEQVAQILSARRFDNDTRAQIVRLINDRAQQLVPAAAKRVLNDWTQTTLAAHRSRALPNEAAVDLAPASRSGQSSDWSPQSKSRPTQSAAANRASAANSPRGVNYRKLSDEQILDM